MTFLGMLIFLIIGQVSAGTKPPQYLRCWDALVEKVVKAEFQNRSAPKVPNALAEAQQYLNHNPTDLKAHEAAALELVSFLNSLGIVAVQRTTNTAEPEVVVEVGDILEGSNSALSAAAAEAKNEKLNLLYSTRNNIRDTAEYRSGDAIVMHWGSTPEMHLSALFGHEFIHHLFYLALKDDRMDFTRRHFTNGRWDIGSRPTGRLPIQARVILPEGWSFGDERMDELYNTEHGFYSHEGSAYLFMAKVYLRIFESLLEKWVRASESVKQQYEDAMKLCFFYFFDAAIRSYQFNDFLLGLSLRTLLAEPDKRKIQFEGDPLLPEMGNVSLTTVWGGEILIPIAQAFRNGGGPMDLQSSRLDNALRSLAGVAAGEFKEIRNLLKHLNSLKGVQAILSPDDSEKMEEMSERIKEILKESGAIQKKHSQTSQPLAEE